MAGKPEEPLTWITMTPLQRVMNMPILGMLASLVILLFVPVAATLLLLFAFGTPNKVAYFLIFGMLYTIWFIYLRRKHGITSRVSVLPAIVTAIVLVAVVRGIYNALMDY